MQTKKGRGDLKDDFKPYLPPVPIEKNGKKIAIIGAGCASMTVANDLLPLGYEMDVFESLPEMGGLIRSNIPKFRLPPEVIDEEFDVIVEQGINLHLIHPIESLSNLLDEDYEHFRHRSAKRKRVYLVDMIPIKFTLGLRLSLLHLIILMK